MGLLREHALPILFAVLNYVSLFDQRTRKCEAPFSSRFQIRWSRRGADLLLQVRCAVYNGAFGHGFGNLFEPTSNTVKQLPLAA
jgi:hypothetical protein